MLREYYLKNIYKVYDLNCSESVLRTADEVFSMGLTHEARRLSSPFGGGMYIEEKCGAVTASLMVLGYFFVKENAHSTDCMREIVHDYFDSFNQLMDSCECKPLKVAHRSEVYGCRDVISASLDILELILDKHSDKKVR